MKMYLRFCKLCQVNVLKFFYCCPCFMHLKHSYFVVAHYKMLFWLFVLINIAAAASSKIYMQGTEASHHMPCPAVHWNFFQAEWETAIQQSLIWRKSAHVHTLKPFWGLFSGQEIRSWHANNSIICTEELSNSELFYLSIVQNLSEQCQFFSPRHLTWLVIVLSMCRTM